jgi:hypothetical protein
MAGRVILVALMVLTATLPAAASTAAADGEPATHTHVAFETEANAVTDYRINGATAFESLTVSGSADGDGGGSGLGADANATAGASGSNLSVAARTDARTTLRAESGATLTAHDNRRGVLVVDAGSSNQTVTVEVGADAETRAESDSRATVTTTNGTTGSFLVVGDGSVNVADDGNVTADLGANASLVFRSNGDERSEAERRQEKLIVDGAAAGEVYLGASDSDSDDEGASTVRYDENTSITVTEREPSAVSMRVERTADEGRVILVQASDAVAGSAERLSVTVDGEAAARASSYAELRSAADGGANSKYLISEDAEASADARTTVLVGVNHFSARNVALRQDADRTTSPSGDGTSTGTDGDSTETTADAGRNSADRETTSTSVPGFGTALAVVAVAIGVLLSKRRDGR